MSNGTETKASLTRRDFLATATVAGLGAVTGTPARAANQMVSARSASRVLGAGEKKPVVEWLKSQGRFRHLFAPQNEYLIEEIQQDVDRRWQRLLALEAMDKGQ